MPWVLHARRGHTQTVPGEVSAVWAMAFGVLPCWCLRMSNFQGFPALTWWDLNNDNKHYNIFKYSIGHVPGAVPSISHLLTNLILTTSRRR